MRFVIKTTAALLAGAIVVRATNALATGLALFLTLLAIYAGWVIARIVLDYYWPRPYPWWREPKRSEKNIG